MPTSVRIIIPPHYLHQIKSDSDVCYLNLVQNNEDALLKQTTWREGLVSAQ